VPAPSPSFTRNDKSRKSYGRAEKCMPGKGETQGNLFDGVERRSSGKACRANCRAMRAGWSVRGVSGRSELRAKG